MSKIKRALAALLALVLVLAAGPQAFAAEAGTYAKEQGLEFTQETEFTAPFCAYYSKDGVENLPISGFSFSPLRDAMYSIKSATVSEADENGMVTAVISVESRCDSIIEHTRTILTPQVKVHCFATNFTLFDLYSGYDIPFRDLYNDDMTEGAAEFEFDGRTVPVSATIATNAIMSEWHDDSLTKYFTWQSIWTYQNVIEYTIKYPADYDGLCLALYKPGRTEHEEDDPDETLESRPLIDLEDGVTGDDYYCIRVTDLLAAFGAEG